ncbi:MAG: GAF domain-containing SpoIIE family protein phosphatase [Candidatus Kapaibacterium sp.]
MKIDIQGDYEFKNNSPVYYSVAIIALILKCVLDSVFLASGQVPASFGLISSSMLAISYVTGILLARHGQIATKIVRHSSANVGKIILEGLSRILLQLLITFLTSGILLLLFIDDQSPSGVIEGAVMNSIGAMFLFMGVEVYLFLYYALHIRRNEKTKKFTKILSVGTVILYAVMALIRASAPESDNPLAGIGVFFLSLIFILTVGRTPWVALLTKKEKKRLAWLSAVGFFAFTFIGTVVVFNDPPGLHHAIEFFLPASTGLVGMAMLFGSMYAARLCGPALMSLPTASAVDRRNSEVSSLTHLNRIIAETIDFDTLIDNLTQRAMDVSRASAAWCELYSHTDERSIASMKFINKEQIDWLYNFTAFDTLIHGCTVPMMIESFDENKDLSPISSFPKPIARSMIVIPLFEGTSKIGSLIVLHIQNFGFEIDDVNVLASFGDNISIALKNARLIRESIKNERIQHEIQVARQIQTKLLPQKIPSVCGFDIAPFSLPANEVGGDYYDVIKLQDGRVAVFMGDVSGKGVPAAFYMAKLKGVVLALAREVSGARDFLSKINSTMYGNIDRQTYITLSCVILEPNSPVISLARAGHMPFLVKQHGGVSVVTPRGLGIGLAPAKIFDANLEEYSLELSVGDSCFLFTDGLSELQNPQSQDFGYEPMLDVLRSPAAHSAQTIISEVMKSADRHAQGHPQHDDMTALAFIFRGTNKILTE